MESGTASDVGICGALGVQTGSEGNDGTGSGAAEALGPPPFLGHSRGP